MPTCGLSALGCNLAAIIMHPMPSSNNRHYALDWLRVIGIVGVFIYHSGAPFLPGLWHLKASSVSLPVTILNTWLLLWIMPLFFFISGASCSFALRRQAAWPFIKRKVERLLVPLVWGILVIVPPQVYIERITRGQFNGSFAAFYPNYFNGWYLSIGGNGNFAWMGLHLWYLLFLLVLTVLTLPLLMWIRSNASMWANWSSIRFMKRNWGILLLGAPLIFIELAWGNVGLGGWNMLTYPLFFVYGYILYMTTDGVSRIRAVATPALLGAVIVTISLEASLFADGAVPYGLYAYELQRIGHAVGGWLWILAFVGLAHRSLSHPSVWLSRLNEAVLPVYVLHQTYIVVFGYYVIQLNLGPGSQFLLLALISFLGIVITYTLLVRRIQVFRYLFGMPAAKHKSVLAGRQ